MKINGMGPGSVSGRSGPVRPSAAEQDYNEDDIRVGAVDRAEISTEGLSLARETAMAEAIEAGLEPDRLEEIHGRIESGFYQQPEVIEEVAQRMIAAGDI